MRTSTLSMLRMLPYWTILAKNPEGTVAGGVMDAVARQLDDMDELVENIISTHATEIDPIDIDGINIRDLDQVWRTLYPDNIDLANPAIVGWQDGVAVPIALAENAFDFWKQASVAKYFRDLDDGLLYVNRSFDRVTLEGIELDALQPAPVWGPYDEIGLLLGVPRNPGERNPEYAARLRDVAQKPADSTISGIRNYLARRLEVYAANIDLSDVDISRDLLESDNILLRKKILDRSEKIQSGSGTSFWEVLSDVNTGVDYLPLYWVETGEELVPGVEGESSLVVSPPELRQRMTTFAAILRLEGVAIKKVPVYPEIMFKYKISASGYRLGEGYKPETYRAMVTATERVPIEMTVIGTASAEGGTAILPRSPLIRDSEEWERSTDEKRNEAWIASNIGYNIEAGYSTGRYVELLLDFDPIKSEQEMPVVEGIEFYLTDGGDYISVSIAGDAAPVMGPERTLPSFYKFEEFPFMKGLVLDQYYEVGFDQNTWDDPDPVLRVRCDTGDMVNMQVSSDAQTTVQNKALVLSNSISQRRFDSAGDWADGKMTNLTIAPGGYLKIRQSQPYGVAPAPRRIEMGG